MDLTSFYTSRFSPLFHTVLAFSFMELEFLAAAGSVVVMLDLMRGIFFMTVEFSDRYGLCVPA